MKRTEQLEINELVEKEFDKALDEYMNGVCYHDGIKLRSCQAEVIETVNYYILRSYRTKIACIDKRDGTLYDALRMVYGYTATSSQHVAKFWHDYGGTATKRYYETGRYTYR